MLARLLLLSVVDPPPPLFSPLPRPVSILRNPLAVPRRELRDPRFESLCGRFDADRFRRQYGFLYDEKLPAEAKSFKARRTEWGFVARF